MTIFTPKNGFAVFLILYWGLRFFTIQETPLPWFDEVYFASISKEFADTGLFLRKIRWDLCDRYQHEYIYGPVYFMLGALVFKTIGFGLWQFRLLSLLSGLGLWLAVIWGQKEKLHGRRLYFFSILFLLDPFFNMALTEGRMDFFCAALALLSIIWLHKAWSGNSKGAKAYLVSGFWMAVAMLASPRTGFLLPVFGLGLLVFFFKGKPLKELIFWPIPLLLLYSLWVYLAYGSYTEAFSYYSELAPRFTRSAVFAWYIPPHVKLPALLSFVFVLWGIIEKKLAFFDFYNTFSLASLAAFYLIVWDFGPYTAFVLPFYHILLIRR